MSEQVKALTVTAKATKTLLAAAATLGKTVTDLAENVMLNEAVLEQIAEGQQKLDSLAEATATEVRVQAVDLNLRVQENEDKVLNTLMGKKKLATITVDQLSSLNTEVEEARIDSDVAIQKAVSIAISSANRTHEAAISAAEAEHRVETAELLADVKSKNAEIAFMKTNITTLQETVNAEREARVAMADSASKASGVVVNTSSK